MVIEAAGRRPERRLAWAGLAAAAGYWLLEAAAHALVFGEGSFLYNLTPRSADEAWMRAVTSALFVAFGLYASRTARTVRLEREARQRLQQRLEEALAHILSGYIPICARCKAIRQGEEWVSLEVYLSQHSEARLSHGLCPQCGAAFESQIPGAAE